MNIESIKQEMTLEKQSLQAERTAAFILAPPGQYQVANYQRRESIITRFEYLIFMLEKQQEIEAEQTKDYIEQKAHIKALDMKVRDYEIFFEAFKQILKGTHDAGEKEENSKAAGGPGIFG